MRYAVPLLGSRVAPRCSCADFMLVVSLSRGRISTQERVPLDITSPLSLVPILRNRRIDTVVCGGISRQTREALDTAEIAVIENVACSADELLEALTSGHLCAGYGFGEQAPSSSSGPLGDQPTDGHGINCLSCRDRVCLRGERCSAIPTAPPARQASEIHRMLEAATDISSEEERKLCRLAEVVYFCLEMRYHRIGIAFCEDLREPAEILCGVLERSFETVPVCCKVGGPPPAANDAALPPITCNPVAQAEALNRAGTDLNVIVGLCMGADCIFAQHSAAPVTTLFVKDRSLANNPIGAVYSEYYLRESVPTAQPWSAASPLLEQSSAREEQS